MRVLLALILLGALGVTKGRHIAADQTQPSVGGLPFQIGKLDSSRINQPCPRFFTSPPEINRAKDRIAREPAAKAVIDRAVAEADEQLPLKATPLDESWWLRSKDKPWAETYPEVFENTCVKPSRIARGANSLATAWLLTGTTNYANKAIELLLALAPYSFEPVHYDVGMNYAVWGVKFLEAYDALWPMLTSNQRVQIDECLTRMAAAIARNDVYWIDNNVGGGINNHLAWHKTMLGLLGMFYNRPELVDYSMNGRRGLVPLLADGLVDDGLWCESSLAYQFAAIGPMLIFADCQRRTGTRPALSEVTAANGRTLKQSYDSMFRVLAPNLLIPPIGDAYGQRTSLWKITLYEHAWSIWGDAKYAWLLNQNPARPIASLYSPPTPSNAPAPPVGSVLLPEHGYVFLRSCSDEQYWNNPEAVCAFLTYDRSGVHSNADKLSLMLFGRNRMLLTDAESIATVPHAFSSRVQNELNRGGLSQNTVMIDGQNQRSAPQMLRLVEYHDLPAEKRATATDDTGALYEGVRQMRTIALTPNYVLDVFQVDCGEHVRQIDWIAHIMDDTSTAPAEQNPILAQCQPFDLPKDAAWQWLRNAKSTELTGDIALEWQSAGDRLRLQMLNPDGTRLIACGYPATDQRDSGNIPMVVMRRQAASTVFAAIWLVGDRTEDSKLRHLPSHDGKLVYEVTANSQVRQHFLPRLWTREH